MLLSVLQQPERKNSYSMLLSVLQKPERKNSYSLAECDFEDSHFFIYFLQVRVMLNIKAILTLL